MTKSYLVATFFSLFSLLPIYIYFFFLFFCLVVTIASLQRLTQSSSFQTQLFSFVTIELARKDVSIFIHLTLKKKKKSKNFLASCFCFYFLFRVSFPHCPEQTCRHLLFLLVEVFETKNKFLLDIKSNRKPLFSPLQNIFLLPSSFTILFHSLIAGILFVHRSHFTFL